MRVLVVDTYYPAFLDAHYGKDPALAESSYTEQHAAIMARHFGTGDAYARELRAFGHEAWTVVANCEQLQLAWARERGAGGGAPPPAAAPAAGGGSGGGA